MGRGVNGKPTINNTTTTLHDNRNLTSTAITPRSQQSRVVIGNSSTSPLNDPGSSGMIHSGSAENRSSATNSYSGTIASFNNYGKGSQDFKGAKINSGHNSGQGRGASSNLDNATDNYFSATPPPPSFTCDPGSQITGYERIFSHGNLGNRRGGQEHLVHCSGTLNSFNNHGKGSQDFSHARINSGENSWDI